MLSEVSENIKGQARGKKEKEQKNRNRRTRTGQQRAEGQEQKDKEQKANARKNRNSANSQKNKNRKTRTERQEPRQRTEEQDQRTRRAPTRTKDKANAKQRQGDHHANAKSTTPPRAPIPVLGSRHKRNNKQNNKHRTQTLLLPPQLHSALRASLRCDVNYPALDRAGYTLILFLLSRPSPSPLWGGRGRRQSNKQNKNNELKYNPSKPPSISKQKEKEIHNRTTRQ